MSNAMERSEREGAPLTPLGQTCAAHFAPGVDAGEIDVVELPDEGAVEVQADEWTLYLQGDPVALAFIAIEDEPEGADTMQQALRTVLTPDDLSSLRELDAGLGGTLGERLAASGDALSATLAGLLHRDAPA